MCFEEVDSKWVREIFARDRYGQLDCIPVFGTGLNIQAASVAGYPHKDDWYELLAKISDRVLPATRSIKSLPRTHLSLWESLLCLWAKKTHSYPFKAENKLQRFICEDLRTQERQCRSFKFYFDVGTAGFQDILSLNFDRRIALACRKQSFVTGPSPSPLGSHGESLFRHSVIQHQNGMTTRVWYPHGDVKKASTIKFGVRKYGYFIAVLKEYLEGDSGAWRYHSSSLKHLSRPKQKQRLLQQLPSWVPLFLERPLVFIGCGLSTEEWPLWWLLRRRSENGAPPAVCLMFGKDDDFQHLRSLPEVRVITFESPNKLWSVLFGWLNTDEAKLSHD